jgi:hypothetical protein
VGCKFIKMKNKIFGALFGAAFLVAGAFSFTTEAAEAQSGVHRTRIASDGMCLGNGDECSVMTLPPIIIIIKR